MGLADVWQIARRAPEPELATGADVAVLEDQPELAELAAEVCAGMGLGVATYPAPTPFLEQFTAAPPRLVILDWRLERELGAAVFMAVRHRFGDVPIVCWTAMPEAELPAMVGGDGRTRVADKAGGLAVLEAAIRWALERSVARA